MQKNEGRFCFTHTSGEDIYLFTLCNIKGTEVCITNYGAIITAFKIKQSDGRVHDIVLGFDKVESYLSEEYLSGYPYFGAVIGRYANRIKNGEFKIDGVVYSVAKNKGSDHLHGGLQGFDKKVWKCKSNSSNELVLSYKSPDGEEGYPGNLETTLCFQLTDKNELVYEFTAVTDKATAINLTHHSYFNLNNGAGTIDDHIIKINSSAILEQDNNFVVTGKSISVENTLYDFRSPKHINMNWLPEDGYDQSFVLDKDAPIDSNSGLKFAAEAYSQQSNLKLEVLTNEPLVHFYTGKWIPEIKGKYENGYGPFSGFCLETQKHPNAINISGFPDTVLRPGEIYRTKTMYRIN